VKAATSTRIPDLIDRQRRGRRLTVEELRALILGHVAGNVPDYPVAAWLMAVCCVGMPASQIFDLTRVMVESGVQLDLSKLGPSVVDKHSTGGVGDKTTLVVAPLVAACGVPVAKLSGRGLGFTGGTLDKLESIPGLSVGLEPDRLVDQVQRVGLAIAGQTSQLAPADAQLYALRDVTATVESIPLVASSVMSKKLAGGASIIALDVKVGSGAFVKEESDALELAQVMVAIGRAAGRRMTAIVSDMSQPLGKAVGNALEVQEAIQALQGQGPPDLVELSTLLAGELLALAGRAPEPKAGHSLAERARLDGRGLEQLAAMVSAQGGDERFVYEPGRFEKAPLERVLESPSNGVVGAVDARRVAQAALTLGAGREQKGDQIDPSVGILLAAKVGDEVKRGEPLSRLFARDEGSAVLALQQLEAAFQLSQEASAPPLVHWRSG
jgi:pyrimidine-nucleoside phosphorylase